MKKGEKMESYTHKLDYEIQYAEDFDLKELEKVGITSIEEDLLLENYAYIEIHTREQMRFLKEHPSIIRIIEARKGKLM